MASPLAKRLRRARMGVSTALGVGERGFFSPYRHAAATPAPKGYPEIEAVLAEAAPRFREVLDRIGALDLPEGDGVLRWDQSWFAPLDGAAAFALVADAPPARIVEVGSGHSTRFLAYALRVAGAKAEHVCIDPAPRAAIAALGVTHRAELLDERHLPLFDALGEGDVAFFDSSHLLWPGTDVDLILNRILPRLAEGVRIHVHDVFWPDPSPADWAWRGYTEQLGLGGWLAGGGCAPLFASHYAATRMADALPALPEGGDGARPSSLWMVRA